MKHFYLDLIRIIVLGFMTGVLLSEDGLKLYESSIHILLGCIFWSLITILAKLAHIASNQEKH
ncbi:hypothetical protein [Paenibacillus tarimensis]|uniref:hypothetical protein n=1 Tax=Paenibacillus tarimensis TaxID=416012 RepID=UPI001F3E4D86|nr:hypothetical protein [Paenibacillus tarimensis]MCF2943378.1 hypothetical protein [Paenibacillus tarimensis]